jgi:hypothetical protein
VTTALALIDRARTALAEAKTIQEVKHISDMAAAAQVYARQVKASREAIDHAVEIRVRAERLMGEMLKDSGIHRGGDQRPEAKSSRTTLPDCISRDQSSRAQQLAEIPEEDFELAIQEGKAAGGLSIKGVLESHQLINQSESNEWYTPAEYIEAARKAMGGIDLDPASCVRANAVVQATRFFTAEDDGLAQDWHGRVWLNPPYGRDEENESNQARWSARLLEEYAAARVSQACLLVNATPGNAWFRPLWDHLICFPYRRIAFWEPGGARKAPTHSNAIVGIGIPSGPFVAAFSEIGATVARISF